MRTQVEYICYFFGNQPLCRQLDDLNFPIRQRGWCTGDIRSFGERLFQQEIDDPGAKELISLEGGLCSVENFVGAAGFGQKTGHAQFQNLEDVFFAGIRTDDQNLGKWRVASDFGHRNRTEIIRLDLVHYDQIWLIDFE